MYVVWLLPNRSDDQYLSKIIEYLCQKYNSPKFFPHITIYSNINFELSDIRNAIKTSIEGINPFIVQRSVLKYSDDIWQTVYFDLKPNPSLSRI